MVSKVGVVSALFLVLGVVGCSGGSSSDSASPSGSNVNFLLTDAPAENLDSFVLTLSDITLQTPSGGNVSIFSGTTTVDVVDLVMVSQLLASATVPSGLYSGATLAVTDISATANGGTSQQVNQSAGQPFSFPANFTVVFEDPINIASGLNITIDLDLEDTVTDDVSDPSGNSIIVVPVLFAETDDADDNEVEKSGTVQALNPTGFTLQSGSSSTPVAIYSETEVEAGEVEVTGLAGLALLSVGMQVTVEGTFQSGSFLAYEVEEQEPEMEIIVTAAGGTTLSGTVLEAEGELASAYSSGDSATVDISTADFDAEEGSNANLADFLVLGQKVEAEGLDSAGTVIASKVKAKKTRFSGLITSVTPSSLTLSVTHVEGHSLSLTRTFEIDSETEIEIDDDIPFTPSGLAVDQTVRLRAVRNVDADQWVAMKIEVKPGEMTTTAASLANILPGSFDLNNVDGTDLGLANPVSVTVTTSSETETVLVQNGVSTEISQANLAATLSGLASNTVVKVEGYHDSVSSNVIASEIILITP